jgi:mRNA interferase YafQ
MLKTVYTSRMKRDLKLMKKQGKDIDKLLRVLNTLAEEKILPQENRDHQLTGKLKRFRECHIEPDWLLVYQIKKNELILSAVATGSHVNALREF